MIRTVTARKVIRIIGVVLIAMLSVPVADEIDDYLVMFRAGQASAAPSGAWSRTSPTAVIAEDAPECDEACSCPLCEAMLAQPGLPQAPPQVAQRSSGPSAVDFRDSSFHPEIYRPPSA